jgi:cystine transport system substrate-binding protein
MKKLSLLLVLLTALLVACGTTEEQNTVSNEEQKTGEEQPEEVSLLDEIKNKGEFLIGTEGTYPPFTFHDQETGELTGFDVEITREVANRLGVEPLFKETQWDAMFAGLNSKRFDMVANQVGIRPDRQEKYDFSNPYITSSAVLVVHEDNEAITSYEDINGVKAAQSLTSNYADIAKVNGAEIVSVEGFKEAIELLATKRVDVTINDRLSVLDFLNERKDAPVKIVARQDEVSQSGLMFRKGNPELVEAVNEALQSMMDDGTYLEISKKWFGEDVSK